MQPHKLLGVQRHHRVGPAIVVAELDFVDVRSQVLDHGPDLSTHEAMLGHVLEQGD